VDAAGFFTSVARVIAANDTAAMNIVIRRGWYSAAGLTANTSRAVQPSSITLLVNELTSAAGIKK